jgi:TPR repeat protein
MLEEIAPDPSLEEPTLHLLPYDKIKKLRSAEALLERGRRFFAGYGVKEDKEKGNQFFAEAARLGHPVALARCFDEGISVTKNIERAVQLYRESARRGHPAGTILHDVRAVYAC